MIDTKAELARISAYMEKNMPQTFWSGIMLEGSKAIIAFCLN